MKTVQTPGQVFLPMRLSAFPKTSVVCNVGWVDCQYVCVFDDFSGRSIFPGREAGSRVDVTTAARKGPLPHPRLVTSLFPNIFPSVQRSLSYVQLYALW